MIFAQFYQHGVLTHNIIEACDDRSVIILDGRERKSTWHSLAKTECMKRGYIGYAIFKGENFQELFKFLNTSLVRIYHDA